MVATTGVSTTGTVKDAYGNAAYNVMFPGWGCDTTADKYTIRTIPYGSLTSSPKVFNLMPMLNINAIGTSSSKTDIFQYFELTNLLPNPDSLVCKYSVVAQACSDRTPSQRGGIDFLGSGEGNDAGLNAAAYCSGRTSAVNVFNTAVGDAPGAPITPNEASVQRPSIRGSVVQRVISNVVELAYVSPQVHGTSKVSGYEVTYTIGGQNGQTNTGNPNYLSTAFSVDAPSGDSDIVLSTSAASQQLVHNQVYNAGLVAKNGKSSTSKPSGLFVTAALAPDQVGNRYTSFGSHNSASNPSYQGLDGGNTPSSPSNTGSSNPALINFTSTNGTVAYTSPRRHGKDYINKWTTVPFSSGENPTPRCSNTIVESGVFASNMNTVLSMTNTRLVPFGVQYRIAAIPYNSFSSARGGWPSAEFATNDNDVPASASDGEYCGLQAKTLAYGSAIQNLCWNRSNNFVSL